MDENLKKVEVLIFAREWNLRELAERLNLEEKELEKIIEKINKDLKDRPYYIFYDKYSKKARFEVREKYLNIVKEFIKPELSDLELKILSMIVSNYSYSEIYKTFGAKAKKALEKLEKEGWIKIKKEGRFYKFILTKKFKENFRIKNE
jgi:chromosome segregation and condensation protein ScpB